MCDYITLASSPPLREPSEPVPGVGVGLASRPFSLSVGCYWWGEVMDLPTVLTGTLRINQTVGKTQPAIPPLSRLNCHFISFIYGGSALFWTPPLSNLPLKMLLFFFPPLQSAMATHIHPYPSFLPFSFPGKHSSSHAYCRELVPASVYLVWKWRCEQPVNRQPVNMERTKSYIDSVVLWSTEGLTGLLTLDTAVRVHPAQNFEQYSEQEFTSGLTA